MTCRFCANEASAVCQWPTEHFVICHWEEVKVGDYVRRVTERRGRPAAAVEFLGPFFANHTDTLPSGIQVGLLVRGKSREVIVHRSDLVQIMKLKPCGAPACEAHLRCVDPGHEYCRDHWESWALAG